MAASTRPQPVPVQRDGMTQSHTRNKENIPSPSPLKVPLNVRGRSFIPSLVQSSDKSDFFTDSYIADNNASSESLIPSPLPQSTALSRPRRRVHQSQSVHDQDAKPKHRSTRSEAPISTPRYLPSSPRKPLARGTSPIRSTGLSTPPRSRNGSLTESPTNAQFSSPPRALTETYERIDQEEDLAATEGDISDPESEPRQEDNAGNVDDYEPSRQASAALPRHKSTSPGLTPTGARFPNRGAPAQSEDLTTASVLSDPTGMSFLNQLSDPNIAHAMTPHMLQSAADREALRKIWDAKRPIAFGKANKVHLDADEPVKSIESPPSLPPQRLIAFSKAGKRKLASDLARFPHHHQRTFSDVTDRLEHNTQEVDHHIHNDNWHNEQVRREAMPHNPRIHRAPYFSRTHGFPERQQIAEANGDNRPLRQARSESPYVPPLPTMQNEGQSHRTASAAISSTTPGLNLNRSEPDLTLNNEALTQTSLDVDWAQAAADRPARSMETKPLQRSRSRLSDTNEYETSPEKSRRFDLDFTGQSFQVSESPPVRAKSLTLDSSRQREIQGLAKRAVTTNRLTQLRARESLERLRQRSESPDLQNDVDQTDVSQRANGIPVPDTPVVVYRSNSIGSGRKSSVTAPVRPSPDRSQSHDLLQRLSRQSSSTPRSSTPSDKLANDGFGAQTQRLDDIDVRNILDPQHEYDDTVQSSSKAGADAVKMTPKVTGAWTDTILPDTVRTVKQNTQRPTYAQTPHVNAGGWIETPAPLSQSSRLEPVPESTQEVLAELTSGIAKDNNDASDQTIIAGELAASAPAVIPQVVPSLARKVLAEAKGKSKEQGSAQPTSNVDDSLMLGNVTLQSLEHMLGMDETDMTIMSGAGEATGEVNGEVLVGQTDTEVLGHLGDRVERIYTQLHYARKGLSKLESQISQTEQTATLAGPPTVLSACEVCGQPQPPSHSHLRPSEHQTYFPFTFLNLTLPVPILFRTRSGVSKSRWRLPRPTPLGWLVLTIWTWYILECTLAEIYSHPLYASHYVWPTEREPEFPFVLPTMLWRWSRLRWVYPSLIQPLLRLVLGLFKIVGMWLGLIDGYVDGPQDAVVERLVETVYHQAEGAMANMDMMNDEFL